MLAYDDRGSGSPLVFLHGITCDMAHWEPVVDLLDRDFRCVRIDLPGHGASGGPGADVFEPSAAAAVNEVVESIGVSVPVLVGHSASGLTSLIYALRYPTRGLVVFDQSLDVAAFGAVVLAHKERLEDPDRFEATFADFVEFFRLDLVPSERQALLNAHMNPRQDVVLKMWESLLDDGGAGARAKIEAGLPTLAVPSLHVYSTERTDEEERLVGLAPHAEAETWSGHGHFIQLEDPEKAARRIREFVTERIGT